MARAYIGMGSNIQPQANIRRAMALLAREVRVTAVSTFYKSEAIGEKPQPAFVNGVVAIDTQLPPLELKYSVLRRIESELGRRRSADKFAPRTIDLDLLLYDGLVVATPELTLPDPHLTQRACIAVPLAELAPQLRLPGSGEAVAELARRLEGQRLERVEDLSRSSAKT